MSAALAVGLPGLRVGELRRDRQGRVAWTPDPAWLARDQVPRLGLEFYRNPQVMVAGTGLPPWFENLLPEPGSALRTRLCATHGLREVDSLGLLQALGTDLPGAVDVRPLDAGGGPEAAAGARDGTDGEGPDEDGAGEPRWRFSLAGMQLKLSMRASGDRLAVSARRGGGRWIVKLPGQGYADLPRVEWATMEWARATRLPVPEVKIVPTELLDGLPPGWAETAAEAFAIERFDRRADDTRVHHEDLCQALNLLPAHKYGDTGPHRVGHDSLLRLVRDVAGEDEARQLARRIGFVIASGNDDGHLKNWSLCWGAARRPTLSPVYDHVCTVAWGPHGWGQPGGPTLGLSLGRVRRFADLDAAAVKRCASRADAPWVEEELMEGVEAARRAWPQVAPHAPARMREGLKEHWAAVPLLRPLGGLPG